MPGCRSMKSPVAQGLGAANCSICCRSACLVGLRGCLPLVLGEIPPRFPPCLSESPSLHSHCLRSKGERLAFRAPTSGATSRWSMYSRLGARHAARSTPLFLDLKKRGTIPLHGINYKDRPEDASSWLDELGDPYTRTGADRDGRVAIDWGVYGVPETFIVDRSGVIAYKHIGPLTSEALNGTMLPLVERLRA